MPIARIEDVLQDLKEGKMIILVDDENRENEGDLTMAAEKVTPEAINFMAKTWARTDLPLLSPRDRGTIESSIDGL